MRQGGDEQGQKIGDKGDGKRGRRGKGEGVERCGEGECKDVKEEGVRVRRGRKVSK